MRTRPLRLQIEPLTAEAFKPFGKVIQNPNPDLSPASTGNDVLLAYNGSIANQGTAIKYADLHKSQDRLWDHAGEGRFHLAVSLFSCYPRSLRNHSSGELVFDVNILERHPSTPQTFVPMGLSPEDNETFYLVVVAPSKPSSNTLTGVWKALRYPGNGCATYKPPELANARAFLARGDQTVTYAPATWHAPMAVLGSQKIDFVVWQFATGSANEDCHELLISPEELGADGLFVEVPDSLTDEAQGSRALGKLPTSARSSKL